MPASDDSPPSPGPEANRLLEAVRTSLGPRLRMHRFYQHMNASALASTAGISKAMLSKIESGERIPSVPVLAALATALGISVGDLFGGPSALMPPIHSKAGDGEYRSLAGGVDGEVYELTELRLAGLQLRVMLFVIRNLPKPMPLVQFDGFWIDHVLEGEEIILIGSQRFHLKPGETLTFRGEVPHSVERVAKGPVRTFSIQGWISGTTLNSEANSLASRNRGND